MVGPDLVLLYPSRLLEKMDDKLHLESNPHRGSKFSFFIDLKIIAFEKFITSDKRLKYSRVLLIDDNESSRNVLKNIFTHCELECIVAGNGIEGLQKIQDSEKLIL